MALEYLICDVSTNPQAIKKKRLREDLMGIAVADLDKLFVLFRWNKLLIKKIFSKLWVHLASNITQHYHHVQHKISTTLCLVKN